MLFPLLDLCCMKKGFFGGAIFAVPAQQNDLGISCSCLSNNLFMVKLVDTKSFATREVKRDLTENICWEGQWCGSLLSSELPAQSTV